MRVRKKRRWSTQLFCLATVALISLLCVDAARIRRRHRHRHRSLEFARYMDVKLTNAELIFLFLKHCFHFVTRSVSIQCDNTAVSLYAATVGVAYRSVRLSLYSPGDAVAVVKRNRYR